jgi:pimeloyl-ACP methyl ester carboxylesterase
MKSFSFILCLFSAVAMADFKEFYFQRFQKKQEAVKWAGDSDPISNTANARNFTQRLNPLDSSDPRTFTQRYYINTQYAENKLSPTLFFLCGEATCEGLPKSLNYFGKILKANLIALEHRYYGKSQPFENLSTENLKYLSTDYALKDAASFQKYAMDTLGFQGKWIVVGGSYAGSLAAYYREKYPELVVGALSSSGPVRAEANFEDYDRHVATVAGPECLADIKTVVAQLESALSNPEQLAALKVKFSAEKLIDALDFVYLVADMGALAIQYGYRDHFCSLLHTKNPMEGYAKFTREIYNTWGIDALSGSAAGATSLNPADYEKGAGIRQWFYQSCTEYGYWQNAYHEEKLSARSQMINSEYHASICRRLFGIETAAQTEALNRKFYFPLFESSTSNIFFSNGSRDPWMNLSIAKENGNDLNPKNVVITIDGAAHCDDLRMNPSDSSSIKEARSKFLDLARDWIK